MRGDSLKVQVLKPKEKRPTTCGCQLWLHESACMIKVKGGQTADSLLGDLCFAGMNCCRCTIGVVVRCLAARDYQSPGSWEAVGSTAAMEFF